VRAVLERGPCDGLVLEVDGLRPHVVALAPPVDVLAEPFADPDAVIVPVELVYELLAVPCALAIAVGATPHAHPCRTRDGSVRYRWRP